MIGEFFSNFKDWLVAEKKALWVTINKARLNSGGGSPSHESHHLNNIIIGVGLHEIFYNLRILMPEPIGHMYAVLI